MAVEDKLDKIIGDLGEIKTDIAVIKSKRYSERLAENSKAIAEVETRLTDLERDIAVVAAQKHEARLGEVEAKVLEMRISWIKALAYFSAAQIFIGVVWTVFGSKIINALS